MTTKSNLDLDWEIFRAYDIRGLYPSQVNEDFFYHIARGYAHVFKPDTVAVGMDPRESSPSLKGAIVRGLLKSGVNVVDFGEITTDMLYFAVGHFGYSGGLVVSASHNPAGYNGLKLVGESAAAISSDSGLFRLRDALKAGVPEPGSSRKAGSYSEKKLQSIYVDHILKFVDPAVIRSTTVVANGNFGFVARPVQEIVSKIGVEIIPLNFEPDGTFPKGPPNPMLAENRIETAETLRNSSAEFAVMWDADADRVMFLDEHADVVYGVYLNALLAHIMLEKHGPNNTVIFDPRVTWPIRRVISEAGAHAALNKSGHAFIKDRMRKEHALYGGELSGHYYFRDNYYSDNGIIPFLLVLERLSTTGSAMSDLFAPFRAGHFMSGEMNYEVPGRIEQILGDIRKRYHSAGEEDFTDGYSVECKAWRFNIRPSNTEPLLRLNIEARNSDSVRSLRSDLESMISTGQS